MVYKKYKKTIKNITETSMLGAAGSMALGGMGGAVAGHGQAGIAGATRFMPVAGSMIGMGMLMDSIPKMKRRKKK